MELKEIWEQAAEQYVIDQWGSHDYTEEAFMAGCEFEHNRKHWFDPEKVLPVQDQKYMKFERSILVLIKDENENITTATVSLHSKRWYIDGHSFGKVISWAYIPK